MTQHLMNQALDLIRSGCADTVARERVTIVSDVERLERKEYQIMREWNNLRADFEKRAAEILSQSSFAEAYVPYITTALHDNSPPVSSWEYYIEQEGRK